MKRKIYTLVALMLSLVLALGTLAGCSKGDDEAAQSWTLEDVDGHWYLAESATLEGNAEILFGYQQYFHLDAELECWWELHESGEFYTGGGPAEVEPEGWLVLNSGEELEVAFYIWDANTLTDEEGYTLFVRGGEPGTPSAGAVSNPLPEPLPHPSSEPVPGEDWRTWRSYSDDYVISDDLTVTFSLFDEADGFAVYSAWDGERIASLIYPEGMSASWEDMFWVEDYDGDGLNDIGLFLEDGTELWFLFWPDRMGSWPDDPEGCFVLYDIVYPAAQDTGQYVGRWHCGVLLLVINDDGTVVIDTIDDRYNGNYTTTLGGELLLTATADNGSAIPGDTVEWLCRLESDGTLSVTPLQIGEYGLLKEPTAFSSGE